MSANLIPMHDRGPVPNGRKQYGLRCCLASWENLQINKNIAMINNVKTPGSCLILSLKLLQVTVNAFVY